MEVKLGAMNRPLYYILLYLSHDYSFFKLQEARAVVESTWRRPAPNDMHVPHDIGDKRDRCLTKA